MLIRIVATICVLMPWIHQGVVMAKDGRAIVERVVEAVGGREHFYALKDVEYTYTYHDLGDDKKDVSIERYVFDGELSWARYTTREKYALPQMTGELIQGYDGKKSWMTLDGVAIQDNDPQLYKMADFSRKTNFYWFAMMFKLLDKGVNYEYQGTNDVDGVEYDLVRIGFQPGVGDVQDTYVLYVNTGTHLVDRFLFTVLDYGVSNPQLMLVEYEEISGLKLPVRRRYIASDWEGNITGDSWKEEISTGIKFNNGFTRDLFTEPSN